MESSTNPLRCAICGTQMYDRAFLVVEDSWLDRVKILAWHPVFAQPQGMRSVCGRRHLEILLTHWLTYGNLDFCLSTAPEFADISDDRGEAAQTFNRCSGRLIGELAVHRDSLSPLWTGSAETRESIFRALIDGIEHVSTAPLADVAIPPAMDINESREAYAEYAFQ